MSTSNAARIALGTAGSNIAGNIEVLLPQLAARGAEVAVAGNQIHEKLKNLRNIGEGFKNDKAETITPAAFDKCAEEIKAILPQLKGHGAEVDAVAMAINNYCTQLLSVHGQQQHLIDPANAAPVATPHVNIGLGGAPYNTGTAVLVGGAPDAAKVDPNPRPAGDGTE